MGKHAQGSQTVLNITPPTRTTHNRHGPHARKQKNRIRNSEECKSPHPCALSCRIREQASRVRTSDRPRRRHFSSVFMHEWHALLGLKPVVQPTNCGGDASRLVFRRVWRRELSQLPPWPVRLLDRGALFSRHRQSVVRSSAYGWQPRPQGASEHVDSTSAAVNTSTVRVLSAENKL